MKVLLVEDAEGMRRMVAGMLKGLGYDDLVTAENGQDALDIFDSVDIDLLLTNWNMPVMDGLQLVTAVRSRSHNATLPIIMFTSKASRADVVQALQAGVDGYVAKPFSPVQLGEQIRQVVQRRSRQQVDRVLAGLDPVRRHDEHPLILVAERALDPGQLGKLENADVLRYLDQLVKGIKQINDDASTPLIGVAGRGNSTEVTRLLHHTGPRTKALLVNASLPGGLTLARLASVNRRVDAHVLVTFGRRDEIPEKIRFGLERLDVTLLDRANLDASSLQQVATDLVLAGTRERPSELPSPDEIRQRLRADVLTSVALPVMPKVFNSIAELARDPDSDISRWVEAIRADPLCSAQIVRRAHSPAYGFRGPVNEADQAVILLGKNAVQELVVSDAVQRAFQIVTEDRFDIEDFWQHSACVGLTARLLSLPLTEQDRSAEQQQEFELFALDDAAIELLQKLDIPQRLSVPRTMDPFMAGMMHDIGKVVLAHGYPGLFPAVLEALEAEQWNVPMQRAEQGIAGGADHTNVGSILAETWHLGEDVTAVVREHHAPSPDDPLIAIVALANAVASGVQPYPKEATYPLARLARSDEPRDDAELEAAKAFLPQPLCDDVGFSANDLVDLAWHVGPPVRKRADELRESL